MPVAGMVDRFLGRAVLMLGEIQPGTKMPAFARKDDGANPVWRVGKKSVQFRDQGIIHRIALFRAVENDDRDVVVAFNAGCLLGGRVAWHCGCSWYFICVGGRMFFNITVMLNSNL